MSPGSSVQEIEDLLAQLRSQVARLRRLEGSSREESDLDSTKRTIDELHWRLSRLVGNHSLAVHSAAA